MAVYWTFAARDIDREEDYDTSMTRDRPSHEILQDVEVRPVAGFALVRAREEAKRVHFIFTFIRDALVYITFLGLVFALCYASLPTAARITNQHVTQTFVNKAPPNCTAFADIHSRDQFWLWLMGYGLQAVYLEQVDPLSTNGHLVGVVRLRQIRSIQAACVAQSTFDNAGAGSLLSHGCYADPDWTEDVKPYGPGWVEDCANCTWKHDPASLTDSDHFHGLVATYNGGGYVQRLGSSLIGSQLATQYLRHNDWVNRGTRAVFMELNWYWPANGQLTSITLAVEFALTGEVLTRQSINTFQLLSHRVNSVSTLTVIESFLALIFLCFVYRIIQSSRDQGWAYLKSIWNWLELAIAALTLTSICLYIAVVVMDTAWLARHVTTQAVHINYSTNVARRVSWSAVNACLLFFLILVAVGQLLHLLRPVLVFSRTLHQSSGPIIGCALILTLLLTAYSQLAYLVWGSSVSMFRDIGNSLLTGVGLIRGSIQYDVTWSIGGGAALLNMTYIFLTLTLVESLLIAVLIKTFRSVKSRGYHHDDKSIVGLVATQFKRWMSPKKEKPAFRRVHFGDAVSQSDSKQTTGDQLKTRFYSSADPDDQSQTSYQTDADLKLYREASAAESEEVKVKAAEVTEPYADLSTPVTDKKLPAAGDVKVKGNTVATRLDAKRVFQLLRQGSLSDADSNSIDLPVSPSAHSPAIQPHNLNFDYSTAPTINTLPVGAAAAAAAAAGDGGDEDGESVTSGVHNDVTEAGERRHAWSQ